MIEYENYGCTGGDVFQAGDFNSLEVDSKREFNECDYEAADHSGMITPRPVLKD